MTLKYHKGTESTVDTVVWNFSNYFLSLAGYLILPFFINLFILFYLFAIQ